MDDLLLSEKGLPELLQMVSRVRFDDGNELESMKKTLKIMELWSHRLNPRFTFDDFIGKCEKLGKKRAIKTHLRKTRIGMESI